MPMDRSNCKTESDILIDEWNNFLERINCKTESDILGNDENVLHLRQWASLRGQTLYRTGTLPQWRI
jgi:hypothetical protein